MLRALPNHPLTRLFLLFGVGVVVVGIFIFWGRKRRGQALDEMAGLERRLQFSQAGPVAPSAAVLEALHRANKQLEKNNASLDARLFKKGGHPWPVFSGNSTAAYFELAGFVEEMTRRFDLAGIVLPESARFGFSQFSQQGPESEILASVMAQKVAAEVILEPLLRAKPRALASFRREHLALAPESEMVLKKAVGTQSSSRIRSDDTIEGKEKVAGLESYAFEIVFEGYTESLRRYVKRLLEAAVPVVVTGLDVQPLERFGRSEPIQSFVRSSNPFDVLAAENETSMEGGPVPIIGNNLSSFSLRVEVYTGRETASGL